jgi:serine/threonine protein kinase
VRQPVPFGKYLLLDRISVGGMAEVFKAKSYGVEGFEKIIAIKRILPTMGEDRDFIKMFIDEAKIAGQLAHANICQIFELGRIDGSHFIAMEYIWGKDLLQIQNRLRKIKQPMPISMACFSIAKVLEGLDYAHRKRDPLGRPLEIVHRDCSPQNVLVSYEGEVKVIDFGIAKATSRNSRTMAGVLKGKFGYMSPEQVRGLPLDRRSDIFALGTMLYECLTGDRLFQGETDFSTLEKVRNVDIRPPREINPNIPQAVEAVILKALAKDVEERYQWCSEMLADLQAFLMSQDVVFTAKSLSSWLKEVFSTEIDRERQQLEQYKRVGRDGLFQGVPAAEAKVDVVETLGEAGPVEGDPTTLGGPNFEDVEQAAGAAPEIGPAPGSPAARGGPLDDDEDGAGDFGEEAPTEIFGEIDHGANPAAPAAPSSRAPTAAQPPLTRPPKPPPSNRAPTARGESSQPMAAQPRLPGMTPSPVLSHNTPGPSLQRPSAPALQGQGFVPATTPPPGFAVQSYANPANAGAPYQQYGPPPQAGYMPQSHVAVPQPGYPGQQPGMGSQPIALGTPSAMPVAPSSPPMNGMAPPTQGQGRTLMGAAAPAGLPNYGQGYPPQYGQYPGQPQMPSPQMQGYQGSPYPQVQHNPYAPSGQYITAAPPVEQIPQPEGKKKSSIARDVAIGVAIAALVLGGFLAVKFFILDADSTSSEPTPPASAIATIRLKMAPGVSAELFVDDKEKAAVRDTQEIPVSAGAHKVKLVGPNGVRCEQEMKLAPGKTTTLECLMNAAGSGDGSAKPAVGPGSGSAVGSGSTVGSGSAAGGGLQGSNDAKPDTKPSDHPVLDKTDKMPIEDKAKPADKAADKISDKPADKASDKPADKVSSKTMEHAASKPADKVVKTPDRIKPVKPPVVEDDPLGRLQGGTKPGDKKPLDVKKPADKPSDEPSLKQPPRSPADAKGYAAISSTPSARISIDGKDTGLSTPISGRALPLSPGRHKVTFVIGGDKFTFSVTIKAGDTTALHKELGG